MATNSETTPHNEAQQDNISILECRASKHTFKPKKVRKFVESLLDGRVLNLFAGKTQLRHDEEVIRNDINPEIDTDYSFDAVEVGNHFEPKTFDTVILDPPYSFRKSHDYYDGEKIENLTKVKNEVAELVKPGGHVLSFGYHTRALGKSRGFKRKQITLLDHYGGVRATIAVYEQRVENDLFSFV